MTIRRIALTVLGFAGGALTALLLCVSAQNTLAETAAPAQPSFEQPAQVLEFPFDIPNTTLRAESITGYDGPFLEDGSDREVVNVAALIVCNTGTETVKSVYITLQWGSGAYAFWGTYIPPGETTVLLEQNAQAFRAVEFNVCAGRQTDVSTSLIRSEIAVTEEGMGTVILTNPSDRTITDIVVFYKIWLSPPGMCVGGITYAVDIPILLPGESLRLFPDHYAVGYTKVVAILGAVT